jgi:hypothetical protein
LTLEEITEKLEKIKAKDAVLLKDFYSRSKQGKPEKIITKTSQYVGVFLRRDRGKWVAKIGFRNKQYNLGNYDVEEDAALAYDKKALKLYGETARLNFPKK